ncbi:MAG: RecX family transcriptional regulator [Flavobacteriales bacterium]|jgi:regulatory protein|nr:RecX family transcriptional regulator [Flavobacteriales bacterium]
MTYNQVLEKLKHFCAYQERCQDEVLQKLWTYHLDEEERLNIIAQLISENYLNEERFAIAFSEGKFRIKKWGKNKIKMKLKEKKVSSYCIQKGLNAIEDEEYTSVLQNLVSNKYATVKAPTLYQKKQKVAVYCYQKGYESDLIWELINQLIQE